MRRPQACLVVAALLLTAAAWAQEEPAAAATQPAAPKEPTVEDMASDTDPTKPVAFSFRDEYYAFRGNAWRNVFMARMDRLVLKDKKFPLNAQGLILRADLPLVTQDTGRETQTGLGDLYGQALLIARPKKTFLLAYGTGLVLPTATDNSLGQGKWVLAPAVVPVWYFPKKGFAYLKIQDWVSFAGDSDRADVHYMTVTPTLLWRVSRRWWMVLDAESNTNWNRDDATWYKAGLLVGHMTSSRGGLSLKVEVPFGDQRPFDVIVKAVFFRTRF